MNNSDVIRKFYAAFNRGDTQSVLGYIAADVSWTPAESNPLRPDGQAVLGKDAVVTEIFAKLPRVFAGLRTEISSVWDAGHVVVAEGRYKAQHTATSAPIDHQFCHVWKLRDGLIVRFQQYTDTAKLHALLRPESSGAQHAEDNSRSITNRPDNLQTSSYAKAETGLVVATLLLAFGFQVFLLADILTSSNPA